MSEEDHIFFWYSCTFFAIGLTRKGDFRLPNGGIVQDYTNGKGERAIFVQTKHAYLRFGRL